MDKLYVDIAQGAPRYVYTGCNSCRSLMGTSLCETKGRGCCHYFPEFTLMDIQRMSLTLEGTHVLESIRQHPASVIYPYHIHVKGSFDRQGYEKYIESGILLGEGIIHDQTVFFRVCPFVKPGNGCTLPQGFRTYVCDFFVCSEILEDPSREEELKPYIDERQRYVRWLEWEIGSLKHILQEQKLNLVDHFDECLELLRETPVSIYEFPELSPVEFSGGSFSKGA